MTHTVSEANQIDREIHKLCDIYSATRIKVGMNLAERLYQAEKDSLYLKIDSKAFPNFEAYISSLGMGYHPARDLISMYQSFVLAGGYDIEFLSTVPYHKLAIIKPELFKREGGIYVMVKSKEEADRWIADAKSDLTLNDLRQKRRELKMGDHEHEFTTITYEQCTHCKLRVKRF